MTIKRISVYVASILSMWETKFNWFDWYQGNVIYSISGGRMLETCSGNPIPISCKMGLIVSCGAYVYTDNNIYST